MTQSEYLTVTALTKYISRKFAVDPYLEKIYLVGEISNFRLRSRHQYFSIKDENAKIEAVMFQSKFKNVKFMPEDGMKVLVTGRIEVYEQIGKYQINIDTMHREGIGDLYQAYEQLKEKLTKEGVFSHPKRPLVKFPKRIAVITSPSGAVIHDIITTTRRRYPIVQLVLFPAEVQGEYAKDSLVARLKEVNARGNFDTIIIGRGGGSLEDLWPFNEKEVARAIANSKIPVISSVGHETDTTLADLAADDRAATPTAAAELATPVLTDVLVSLKNMQVRLINAIQMIIRQKKEILSKIQHAYIFTQPSRLYNSYVQNLDLLETKLNQLMEQKLQIIRQKLIILDKHLGTSNPHYLIKTDLMHLKQLRYKLKHVFLNELNQEKQKVTQQLHALEILNPLYVMQRGFVYVTDPQKEQIISSVAEITLNAEFTVHFKDGAVTVKVKNIRKDD